MQPGSEQNQSQKTSGNGEPLNGDQDFLIGSIIDGKYRIISHIGGGGMGAVYKAEHVMMARMVAIKILHRHLASPHLESGEFMKRFQREARTACKIEHPNATTIYDFGYFDDQAYLVMQYNPGKELKKILAEEGPLPARRCYVILGQVCRAVAAAHKLNIIHRDLKPDNIMCFFDDDGSERVQVLDFGLAKVLGDGDPENSTMTKTGIVMGTPQYMAPEQAVGLELDGRSDLYSLGVILYEMLTGTQPFSAENPMQLMLKHINEVPELPSKRNPKAGISPELEALVMKALKKEPKNRQQSVLEFLKELRTAVKGGRESRVRTRVISKVDEERPSAIASNPGASRLEGEAPAQTNTKEKSSRIKKKRWKLRHIAAMIVLGVVFGIGADAGLSYFSPEAIQKREEQAKIRREVNSHLERARQFVIDNNFNSAVYELIKALEVDPKSAKTYFELGRVYAKQARYDQALVVLENAIKLDPKFALAYAEIGDVHQTRGNLQTAQEFLKKAAALDPKNTRIRSELKKLEKKMRRR